MELDKIEIRIVGPGEVVAASNLVVRVFKRFVAPQFPTEGVNEFLSYATVPALEQRLAEGNLFLAAWSGERMAAFIEVRDCEHIAFFFTDSLMQRQGLGRRILQRALDLCLKRNGNLSQVTVNSSPNAVEAYRRLGFRPTGGRQTRNGISFVPMALAINPDSGHT